MIDPSIIGNFKGFNDYQEAAQKNNLAAALMQAKLASASSGGDLPAPLKLANEYQRRLESGDIAGANAIMQFAKTQDRGMQVNAGGTFSPLSGYAGAIGEIEAAKAGAKEQAQSNVELRMKPLIESNTKAAEIMAANKTNAAAILPQYSAQVAEQKGLIDALLREKGLSRSVGMGSIIPSRPGSEAADFETRLEQVKGKNFLEAFNQLRGAGAITEAEGTKATAAMSRLNQRSSEKAFRQAAVELQTILDSGLQRASAKANAPINSLDDVLANYQSKQSEQKSPSLSPRDYSESIFNAKKAIQKNPSARPAIIKKLEDAGISTSGL